MIIKVCGINDEENLLQIDGLNVDMVGFNFYPSSSRYLANPFLNVQTAKLKVGVFVNETQEIILQKANIFNLDFVQLHGDEGVEFTYEIQKHIPVIKVFRIHPSFDFSQISDFDFCYYHLFDTASEGFGGSGLKFDWDLLQKQPLEIPFLLSGGISPHDVEKINAFQHPFFTGIDINSKFEINPGIKNVGMIDEFIGRLGKYV